MENLKQKWQAMSLPMKALTILGLPLVIAFFLLKASGSIAGLLNSSARATTDEKDKELKQEEGKIEQDIARTEGHLETLESDKKDALKEANSEKASDFINGRYGSDK